MWDNGDGEMGRKDGTVLDKYGQRTTNNLRAYCRSGIMGMADKVSGKDSGRRSRRWICGTTCGTATDEMRDDVNVKMGWKNGDREGKY